MLAISNWEGDLSPEQINYAALDVALMAWTLAWTWGSLTRRVVLDGRRRHHALGWEEVAGLLGELDGACLPLGGADAQSQEDEEKEDGHD